MNPAEWITPSACASEYGVPLEIVALHLQCGEITTGTLCGKLVVLRAEIAALALKMRAGLAVEDEL